MALDKDLEDKEAQGRLPFNELEKNAAAFKGMFGIMNTSALNEAFSNEAFSKSFNIYNDDIISNSDDIIKSYTYSSTKPYQTRNNPSDGTNLTVH